MLVEQGPRAAPFEVADSSAILRRGGAWAARRAGTPCRWQPAVWGRGHAGPSRRLFHRECAQSAGSGQTMAYAHPEPLPDLAAGCAAPRDAATRSHRPKDRRTIGPPHRRNKARVADATCFQATTLPGERRVGFRPSSESGSRDNPHDARAPTHAPAPPPTARDSEPSVQTQAVLPTTAQFPL